jgi:ferredoxin-type protein NapH
MNVKETIVKNKWRYLTLVLGFFLFVGPFALAVRGVYSLMDNQAAATLHSFCFRMPFSWLFEGRYYSVFASVVMAGFAFGVTILSIFIGPIFCGWLCPVGAISEGLSRAIPIPNKYRLKIRDPALTSMLRYGFLAGFILVGVLVGYKFVASTELSTVCCRYCASAVLQTMADAVFVSPLALEYWHSGAIIVLVAWLVIGGLFMVGGRGWCLFFCPLGAISGLAHKLGAKLGFLRMEYNASKCHNCKGCSDRCMMWAIKEDRTVERALCTNCKECSNMCPQGAYTLKWGRKHAQSA